MKVFVKLLSGTEITVDCEEDDTVEFVKMKISNSAGFFIIFHTLPHNYIYNFHINSGSSVDRQRLLFAGQRLEEGKTLFDYNVKDESTLYVVQVRIMIQ
jgi:hypothetical protein